MTRKNSTSSTLYPTNVGAPNHKNKYMRTTAQVQEHVLQNYKTKNVEVTVSTPVSKMTAVLKYSYTPDEVQSIMRHAQVITDGSLVWRRTTGTQPDGWTIAKA